MTSRRVTEQILARPTSDGAGVKLLRVFGGARPERFDPFLLMDEFGSNTVDDYIGGFPAHPHRGFITITYMLQGKMEHQDHMGNIGLLNDGDVQWMTAGKGVVHSEMPKQTEGAMRGFQVWLNLPAATKMQKAHYEDVPGNKIPEYLVGNARIKAIAGTTSINRENIEGYFQVEDSHALYLDISIPPSESLEIALNTGSNAMIYVYEGNVLLGDAKTPAKRQSLSRLSDTGNVLLNNGGNEEARAIVLSGKPFNEKIAQYGPFVMNESEEIERAISDYREGVLTD